MTPRERVERAINHESPDRVPLDPGSTSVTGIQLPCTLFGFRNEHWKPRRLFDGTEVLVAGGFEHGEIFEIQTDMALKNLEVYRQACGERIGVIDVSETDFGGQSGLLFSRNVFGELFKPRLERINRWIHAHTGWKIFSHSCGAIAGILEDFDEIGVDIINPVLYTTPDEIRGEARRNIETLSAGGGFGFSAVHDIQANIPGENLAARFDAFKTHRCSDDAKAR